MTTAIKTQEFQRLSLNGTVLAKAAVRRERFWRKMARIVDGKAQWVMEPEDRLVFAGAETGEYSLDLSVSSEERCKAHWEGYLETNGIRCAPAVGEWIIFPSGSDPTGYRHGRVLKVGPRRVTVEYKFKNGIVTTKSVPRHLCRFKP